MGSSFSIYNTTDYDVMLDWHCSGAAIKWCTVGLGSLAAVVTAGAAGAVIIAEGVCAGVAVAGAGATGAIAITGIGCAAANKGTSKENLTLAAVDQVRRECVNRGISFVLKANARNVKVFNGTLSLVQGVDAVWLNPNALGAACSRDCWTAVCNDDNFDYYIKEDGNGGIKLVDENDY